MKFRSIFKVKWFEQKKIKNIYVVYKSDGEYIESGGNLA